MVWFLSASALILALPALCHLPGKKLPFAIRAALFAAAAALALAAVLIFSKSAPTTCKVTNYQDFCTLLEQSEEVSYHHSQVFYPVTASTFVSSSSYQVENDPQLMAQLRELLSCGQPIQDAPKLPSKDDSDSLQFLEEKQKDGIVYYSLHEAEEGCYLERTFLPEEGQLKKTVLALLPPGTEEEVYRLFLYREESIIPLSPTELAFFNDGSFFDNAHPRTYTGVNIHNQFLNSFYDDPRDIDLHQLFYLGSTLHPSNALTPEEWDALGLTPDTAPCPVTRISAEHMDLILRSRAGISLAQTNGVGLHHFRYLEQFDAYYHMHGDTNYNTTLHFTSGLRSGNTVWLYYQDNFGILGGGPCVLTLIQTQGDDYYFQANQPVAAETDVPFPPER